MKLDAYFARIGYAGPVTPTERVLRELHRLHPMAIPFENINAFVGLPVPLDLPSLEAKLVDQRRGGYCFEQNRLFAAVLESIGYRVSTLAARVIWNQGSHPVNPRTHMVLSVESQDKEFLCDVGYGGVTPTAPIALGSSLAQTTSHESYRLVDRDGARELQVQMENAWHAMYVFDSQAQLPIDYEMANYYVTTHPNSHFRVRLIAGLARDTFRYALHNTDLLRLEPDGAKSEESLQSATEVKQVLSKRFSLDLSRIEGFDAALARLL